MSRHRNLNNLTDDDYCDYDDDYYDEEYDDDGYEEQYTAEENEAYYREQERLKEEEAKKKQAVNKLKPAIKKPGVVSNSSTKLHVKVVDSKKSELEKEMLVTSMGFTSEKAQAALQRSSWDVEMAINDLLSSNNGQEENGQQESPGTFSPPPEFSKSTSTMATTSKKTTMAPPPGWSKPSANDRASKKEDKFNTLIKDENPKEKQALSASPKKSQSMSNNNDDDMLYSKPKINAKPKRKLSVELQEQIKSQKSRLSMVILGHVGKVLLFFKFYAQRSQDSVLSFC